jgi:hypothetical protein
MTAAAPKANTITATVRKATIESIKGSGMCQFLLRSLVASR